jgi:hypothetical protein
MDRELVGEDMPAPRRPDRIDVADDVRDGDIGSSELLDKATVAIDPIDSRRFTSDVEHVSGEFRDWREWVVVDLAACHDRDRVVEERGQCAEDSRLGLSTQAEQDDVVPREKSVDKLRHDCVFIAEETVEQLAAAPQAGEQIRAQLILDRPRDKLGSVGCQPLEGSKCLRIR